MELRNCFARKIHWYLTRHCARVSMHSTLILARLDIALYAQTHPDPVEVFDTEYALVSAQWRPKTMVKKIYSTDAT
jgi:hypothetical protein